VEVKILGNVEEEEGEETWAKLKSLFGDFGLIIFINKINEYIM